MAVLMGDRNSQLSPSSLFGLRRGSRQPCRKWICPPSRLIVGVRDGQAGPYTDEEGYCEYPGSGWNGMGNNPNV